MIAVAISLVASLAALASVLLGLYRENRRVDEIKKQVIEESKRIIDDHLHNRNALTSQHGSLSKEHEALSKEHRGLEKYMAEINGTATFLKDQRLVENGRREKLSEKELKIDETVEQLNALTALLLSLKEENVNLKNEMVEIKGLNANLKNKNKILAAENQQLKHQVSPNQAKQFEQFERSDDDELEM